jgi:hypothetical protein
MSVIIYLQKVTSCSRVTCNSFTVQSIIERRFYSWIWSTPYLLSVLYTAATDSNKIWVSSCNFYVPNHSSLYSEYKLKTVWWSIRSYPMCFPSTSSHLLPLSSSFPHSKPPRQAQCSSGNVSAILQSRASALAVLCLGQSRDNILTLSSPLYLCAAITNLRPYLKHLIKSVTYFEMP